MLTLDTVAKNPTLITSEIPLPTGRKAIFRPLEPADETLRTSSIRVINTSSEVSTITATDDTGAAAPNGDVSFTLSANAAREISITDLESGAEDLQPAPRRADRESVRQQRATGHARPR